MSGIDELDKLADALEDFDERVAERAGPEVLKALQKTVRAQQEPDGTPWPPSSNGGAVLTQAASAMALTVTKGDIKIRLEAPYVFHDYGAGGQSQSKEALRARARAERNRAKGGTKSKFHAPRRKMLPDPTDPVPDDVVDALDKATQDTFQEK